MTTTLDSPLLGPDSPLDERQKAVVVRVSAAERASILSLPTDDPLDAKRRHRVEVTRDEMFGQPQAIRATWARNSDALVEISAQIAERTTDRVFLVGAGDSLAVMIASRRALELMLGVPCEPVPSLEFAYYQQHLVTERSMVIALSSSGETTRTVEAVLVAQHAGALTIALTNTPGSSLDQESERTLLIEATRVGWPTQSSTAAIALLMKLATEVGVRRGAPDAAQLVAELQTLPDVIGDVLTANDEPIAEIARAEAARTMYLFSAGGPNWAAAIVGSAKVKETTPDHAVEIEVEEYHHYNTQKPFEPLFIFAPSGPSVPRAVDTGRDARRYGGQLYVITTTGEHAFDEHANAVLTVPPITEALSSLVYLVPAQMIGYHLGMAKFAAAERALAEGAR
ncbi:MULTISPECIES: SIS domain-containing protein [Subtercola]|uniref:Glutamine--fructose-6-phosphate aminotransferase [isomerizing] n=1 Tax=Subtercola vilae TaxID=2056433 RepID=A0A4T2CEP4_9MICO|nr:MULTISPECIES: SIS domain-containing protein [Subtercola]MEA9983960.1 SIS domain-containing protein [Subtercola sp. RTI3]TIH40966.1 SIS domain-containing protein [Subtercola vilae]